MICFLDYIQFCLNDDDLHRKGDDMETIEWQRIATERLAELEHGVVVPWRARDYFSRLALLVLNYLILLSWAVLLLMTFAFAIGKQGNLGGACAVEAIFGGAPFALYALWMLPAPSSIPLSSLDPFRRWYGIPYAMLFRWGRCLLIGGFRRPAR
jgi:hypothetical protein